MILVVCLAGAGPVDLPLAPLAHTAGERASLERTRYVMGAPLTIRVFAPTREAASDATEAAFAEVQALDDLLTTWRPGGKLARLNTELAAASAGEGPITLSPALAARLAESLAWAERTEGLFDPTLGRLVAAWGLRRGGRVPSPGELREARRQSGHDLVDLRPAEGQTPPRLRAVVAGLSFDLGGIGKGMALDAAAATLRGQGVESALLDFGGQVLALGPPPGRSAWTVGIAHPARRGEAALELSLVRGSIATSSNTERGVVADGVALGHLIDPRSGRPTATRASASVLAGTATAADALASALVVGGAETAHVVARQGASWLLLAPSTEGEGLICRASPDLTHHCPRR